MQLRQLIKAPLRALGYDVVKAHRTLSGAVRRQQILSTHAVNLVLDVGANIGDYGLELRQHGYQNRIWSFEPRLDAFRRLEKRAAGSPPWEASQMALGNESGAVAIHLSRNEYSSSLLELHPTHVAAEPEASYVGTEQVEVRRLDEVLAGRTDHESRIFLKVDTQGFEQRVLEGAGALLPAIRCVQLELSLSPLYMGETLFREMIVWMAERGFRIASLEPGIHDPRSGELLQVDATFIRDRGN
jgi:FkbM family methyltransferase